MSEKIDQIVELLNTLTVLEASQLSKRLQDEWGVSAAAPMAVAMPGAAAAGGGGGKRGRRPRGAATRGTGTLRTRRIGTRVRQPRPAFRHRGRDRGDRQCWLS